MTKKQNTIINRVLKGYGERKTIVCFKTAEPERQYITDGVSCFCLYKDFINKTEGDKTDKGKIVDCYNEYIDSRYLNAPDVADLKKMLSHDKAAKYDFGPNAPRVSARRLLDILEFFTNPEIMTTVWEGLLDQQEKNNPIVMGDAGRNQGNALLFPYHK